MRKLLLSFTILLSLQSFAQNKDSLLNILPSIKDEKERVRIIYEILGDGGDTLSKPLYYHKKVLDAVRKMHDKVGEAVATAELGYAINFSGNSAEGLKMIFDALKIAQETNDQQAIGIAYDNLAVCYNDLQKGKEYQLKALTASEAAKDYVFVCCTTTNFLS